MKTDRIAEQQSCYTYLKNTDLSLCCFHAEQSRKAKAGQEAENPRQAIRLGLTKGYQEHSARYYAVNLTNSETVEIRLWKGTLNPETFEATLRFTARLAEICKNTTAAELSKMSFEDLLGSNEVIRSYWERAKER